jgi:hypothetical protein
MACGLLVSSQAAFGAPAKDLAQRETAQRQALTAAIGTPRCESDAQCWAVPVGARACGGAESYLPASRATAEAAKVQQAAAALAATRSAQYQASGRMGICTVLTEPVARCEAAKKRCVLDDGVAKP